MQGEQRSKEIEATRDITVIIVSRHIRPCLSIESRIVHLGCGRCGPQGLLLGRWRTHINWARSEVCASMSEEKAPRIEQSEIKRREDLESGTLVLQHYRSCEHGATENLWLWESKRWHELVFCQLTTMGAQCILMADLNHTSKGEK